MFFDNVLIIYDHYFADFFLTKFNHHNKIIKRSPWTFPLNISLSFSCALPLVQGRKHAARWCFSNRALCVRALGWPLVLSVCEITFEMLLNTFLRFMVGFSVFRSSWGASALTLDGVSKQELVWWFCSFIFFFVWNVLVRMSAGIIECMNVQKWLNFTFCNIIVW